MAKHFNNGVIVYDSQVEKFDMVALPAENIEFPQGVMKKLEYFSDDVVYTLVGYNPQVELAPEHEAKLARMGHIQAVADFAGDQFDIALADRDGIKSAFAAADSALQTAIDTESARAQGVETSLQQGIDDTNDYIIQSVEPVLDDLKGDIEKEIADRIGSDAALQTSIDAEKTRAEGVEGGLQNQINTVDGKVDAEKTRAMAKEAELEGSISTEKTRAELAEQGLQSAIDAEKNRAEGIEAGLRGDVDQNSADLAAEVTRATNKEAELSGSILSEKQRALGEEALIRGELAAGDVATLSSAKSYTDAEVLAEKERAEGEEGRIEGKVDAEVVRATGEEGRIEGLVSAEVARATAAENALGDALQLEEDARIAGDNALQAAVDVEKGRIDAILSASTADADSFKEIVDLINSVDTENDADLAAQVLDFNNYKTSNDAALAQELLDRAAGDAAVQSNLDAYKTSNDAALAAEELRATTKENQLQAGLDAEISSTNTRFASAATDRQAIRDAFAAADSAMEEAFGLEVDALKAQDGVHTADIAANAAAIATEKTRAEGVEAGLAADILAEQNARISGDNAVRGEFAAADTALKGQMEVYTDGAVDGEKVRAMAAEAGLQTQITSNDGELAIINGTVEQVGSIEHAKKGAMDHADAKFNEEKGLREAAVLAEENARIAGDAATLSSANTYTDGEITTLGSFIEGEMNAETAIREGEEQRIEAKHDAYVVSNDAALATEKSQREAADLVNSNAISTEKQRAEGEEARIEAKHDAYVVSNDAALAGEKSARETAVADLQGQFDAHELANSSSFAAAATARGVIADGLAQELLDRAAGDAQTLSDAKAYTDAEVGALETTLTAALDAEIAATNADFVAAETARAGLKSDIDAEKARIDAILSGADADKDSFAEIVALVNSVDTENDTAFAGHVSAYNTKMGQLDATDAAATVDRAAIRSELASEKAVLQGEIVAGDAAVTSAFEAADAALQTAFEAEVDALSSSIEDEIAARVAGDLALTAAFEAADLAEKTAREAADLQLSTDLTNEIARATAKETALENKQNNMFDGEVSVKFTSNAVASAALVLAGGYEYHIVQNSGASSMTELPVLGPNFKVTVTLAAASSESMEFSAPAGMSIDGEQDGKIVMYPGSSVTFVEHAGVYYMM